MAERTARGAVPVRRRRSRRDLLADARRAESHGQAPASGLAWRLAVFLVGRILALAVLLGSLWLLYDAATSPHFQVSRIRLVGNHLTTTGQIQTAAAVGGQNVFWLRPGEVATRLQSLPTIQRADVAVLMPDLVEILVWEPSPFAIWRVEESAFLVDHEGLLLAPVSEATSLPMVLDVGDQAVEPGGRVDADAIRAASLLTRLLPEKGPDDEPFIFEYHRDVGLEVADIDGLRVRFGSIENLAWKVSALQAIRDHLTEEGVEASFVDLRYVERPYYR